ncbi:MAG: NUDIX hydrolase [Spirochaetes bacterium]|nr:NUDIX hydrolase [Spirochaetota bacterium]
MIFPRHKVVVRVAAIIVQNGRLLMVAHKKDRKVYWLLPGGGVMYGESLEEALKREILEELNVSVSVKGPALICDSIEPKGKRHILNISFFCDHREGDYRLGDDRRLHDFRFFDRDEIPSLTVYPPINSSLLSLLEGRQEMTYLGKIWLSTENG